MSIFENLEVFFVHGKGIPPAERTIFELAVRLPDEQSV